TSEIAHILRGTGFHVTSDDEASASACWVRGRLLRAYGDFIYTLQVSTSLQVDLWCAGRLVDTRVYAGFSHPFSFDRQGVASAAFSESFSQLFSELTRACAMWHKSKARRRRSISRSG